MTNTADQPAEQKITDETRAAEAAEADTQPGADRAPTPDEERDAERAAADVDTEETGEHYREMSELGAHVQGEGAVEP